MRTELQMTKSRLRNKWLSVIIFFVINVTGMSQASAADKIVNLVVTYKTVNFAGKSMQAIAVNNQIPAPTLHFKQGDHVTINVYNHLDKGTTIHWHGLIVPWQMDGVEGISQKPIPPGGVFHYQFTLKQAGTYWYHAHSGFQEQQGLYGGLIIDPSHSPKYQYNKDYVVVLSDWSNTKPEQIFANLKKEGDYYSPKLPLQSSLRKFIHDYRKATFEQRKLLISDYKMMQQMRMSIYDISDVAYDAFLLNGQPKTNPWTTPVKVGDTVRLRFIGAGGSTIFRVKVAGTQMKIVHIEGNDVQPYTVDNFSIAPGETYDVLVKIQKNSPYIIYAESIDTLGAAVGALVTDSNQPVNYKQVTPFTEPESVTKDMMKNMMSDMNQSSTSTKMNHEVPMNHSMDMDMPTESSIIGDTISSTNFSPSKMKMDASMPMDHTMPMNHQSLSSGDKTTGTKYQNLIAAVKTNDPNQPISGGIIKMELFGYMERYMWFINGIPEHKAKPILIAPGKRYRIIFINNSMMRHPMHIHGHWFILRNGHGNHDPLLHTIEVPPGATAVADFDTDASGQWFFHCHHLYHMMAGMARVFQYTTLLNIEKGGTKPETVSIQQAYANRPIIRVDEQVPIDISLIHHPMGHPPTLYLANFFDIGADPFHNAQKLNFKGLFGSAYNRLALFANDVELNQGKIDGANLDIFYWHLISQFWAIKGGINYFYQPTNKPYWQPGIGIEGLLPYYIDTNIKSYYHNGSFKFDVELSRDTQITNNFFIRLGVHGIAATKTVTKDSVGSGLNQMRYIVRPYYRLTSALSLFTEFESEQNYGAFKNILRNDGDSTSQNTITVGLSLLF